jgi:hypothetical protein
MTTADADDWRAFAGTIRTLHLATCDDGGMPNASVAPYVRLDVDFFILVSELSAHTAHLAANGRAAIVLVGDEASSPQPFARERLTFDCGAEVVGRDTPLWSRAVEAMRREFGDIVDTLVALADFRLFRLHPRHGTWIRGFGSAWRIEGEGLDRLRHVRPDRDRS